MESSLIYWIWLSERFSQGTVLANSALSHFGSPEAVFKADENALLSARISRRGMIDALLDKDLTHARRILDYCDKNSVGIITFADSLYPEGLKEIDNRPVLIYYRGNPRLLSGNPRIAVVGSRRPSENGLRSTCAVCRELALSGTVIVSGLAAGIDGAAHASALAAGGSGIAVLGCGIDRVYPAENRALYEKMYAGGLVITEYSPGRAPDARNFPLRNRIISALSDAVVVAEAGENSGSIITANFAIRQKKPLYVIPSGIFNREAEGSNRLLEEGAKPFIHPRELMEYLGERYPGWTVSAFREANKTESITEKKELPELSEDEMAVYNRLSAEPQSADILGEGLNPSKVMRILSMLEIKGLSKSLPGGRYALKDI